MPKTHWKQFHDYSYLGAYMMPTDGTDLTYTIKEVRQEFIEGEQGKKDRCPVAYFMEKDVKPMILNATNCRTIEKLYTSPYMDDWSGKKITLYVARVKAFGDVTDALRIRDFVPQDKNIDVSNAIETLKAAPTFADLQAAYTSFTKTEQSHPDVIKAKDDCKKKFK